MTCMPKWQVEYTDLLSTDILLCCTSFVGESQMYWELSILYVFVLMLELQFFYLYYNIKSYIFLTLKDCQNTTDPLNKNDDVQGQGESLEFLWIQYLTWPFSKTSEACKLDLYYRK